MQTIANLRPTSDDLMVETLEMRLEFGFFDFIIEPVKRIVREVVRIILPPTIARCRIRVLFWTIVYPCVRR